MYDLHHLDVRGSWRCRECPERRWFVLAPAGYFASPRHPQRERTGSLVVAKLSLRE